jgi:outer membrane lipoprotein LolB
VSADRPCRPAGAKRYASLLAVAGALGACAALPPSAPTPGEAAFSSIDSPFSIGGRISARRGEAGVAGSFSWTHDAAHDAIDLATPLGQTLARLSGDASEVNVRLSDGRVESAASWPALTMKAFGVTIPVEGLAWWIRGLPRPQARFNVERDAGGRVAALRQDGWDVSYAYADDASQQPVRATLRYPGADPIEVRVVVDRREQVGSAK